jgi:glycosyltransferase involved in cell wall biosynthesis
MSSVHRTFDNRIFNKQLSGLSDLGHDVWFVTPHEKNETVNGVKICNVPIPGNRFLRMTQTTLLIAVKAWKLHADIYQIHDPELLLVAQILRLLGKQVVYDMHENLPKAIRNKLWIHPVLRPIIANFFRFAERILINTIPVLFAETSYKTDYPWIRQSRTVLNFPLVGNLSNLKPKKRPKFTISYIGAVHEERGAIIVLDALKILEKQGLSLNYECVGPFSNSLLLKMNSRVQELKNCKVTFRGFMPASEGMVLISECHIGLAVLKPIGNYIDSYPSKVFEYMALGLPVITSHFPLYKSIVEANKCGLTIDPENPQALANAIQRLFEDHNLYESMVDAGRIAAQTKYNWQTQLEVIINFYEELSGKNFQKRAVEC